MDLRGKSGKWLIGGGVALAGLVLAAGGAIAGVSGGHGQATDADQVKAGHLEVCSDSPYGASLQIPDKGDQGNVGYPSGCHTTSFTLNDGEKINVIATNGFRMTEGGPMTSGQSVGQMTYSQSHPHVHIFQGPNGVTAQVS
jgi:hypothetical protein